MTRDTHSIGTIGFNRHADAGLVRAREIEIMRLLLPHLQRAATISRVLDARSIAIRQLETVLSGLAIPVAVISSNLTVAFAKPALTEMLEMSNRNFDVVNGQLRLRSASGNTLGSLLDKPVNMPSLDKLNMSIVRNYFATGGARYIYAVKSMGDSVLHVSVTLSDTPAKGVVAVTKSVITGAPTAVSGASNLLKELLDKKSVSLNNLLFDVGSDFLLAESREQITEIAMMLREDGGLQLVIVGHTDPDGGASYNLDLSKRRAASVVRALVERFDIDGQRLASSGQGMNEPVSSNDTADGKAQNRRVELRLR